MRNFYLTLLLSLFFTTPLFASHSAGAEITYQCVGPNEYLVSLEFYRDCDGVSALTTETIAYNSANCGLNGFISLAQVGVPIDITPICASVQTTCTGGSIEGVEQYTYQGTLVLPAGCSDIQLEYSLCCRNNNTSTLMAPSTQGIFVTAEIDDTALPCNSSPVFNNSPSIAVCVNQPVIYNFGVSEVDGDSLVFSLTNCLQGAGTDVNYVSGFSGISPLITLSGDSIDVSTGAISFTPNTTQVGVICVLVEEFRNGVKIGEIIRDMQFSVSNCTNIPPQASGIDGSSNAIPSNFMTTICVGAQHCFTINGSDANSDDVIMSWNNEIPNATFTVTNNGTTTPSGEFCWTPSATDVGQTHIFTVNVEDDGCPVIGQSTYTYTIAVNLNPNDPVNAGLDADFCRGESTLLNATTTSPNGVSYSWSPSFGLSSPNIPNPIASPPFTTIYTVELTYNDGCTDTDEVLITVDDAPEATIPVTSNFTCPGSSVTLVGNTNQAGMTFEWFDDASTSLGAGTVGGVQSSITIPSPGTQGVYNYTLQVTNPLTGCINTDTVQISVSQVQPNTCNLIYVSTTGISANPGTQASPVNLEEGLLRGACNGTVLKLATGTYNINDALSIPSNITIEGGFLEGSAWLKTSVPGATTINRTTANPEGAANAQRLVAFYGNGSIGFRFQDVTVTTSNGVNNGMSTYGVHLTSCSDFYFTRTQILAGNGGQGANGNDGANGASGAPGLAGGAGDNDSAAGGGFGGRGGNGNGAGAGIGGLGAGAGTGNNGNNGTASTNPQSGGGGGGGGGGGLDDNEGGNGGIGRNAFGVGGTSAGGLGGDSDGCGTGDIGGIGLGGTTGAFGTNGFLGSIGSVIGGFFTPGGQGGNGTNGTGGRGGGGGGGGGGQGGTFCDDGAGSGGGGGGGGGEGGDLGTGGRGGGSSYGIFLLSNGTNGNVSQSNIAAGAAGLGGIGGTGGTGGAGGTRGLGNTYTGGEVGAGGNGGNGGAGGNGGNGGNGRAGLSNDIFLASGSALAFSDANFNLAAQPVIQAENINCTDTDIDFFDVTSSGVTWSFGTGATPLTGIGNPQTTQFNTIGRKDINLGANNYEGFTNILIDNSTFLPTISTNAPFIDGVYRVCAGDFVNFSADITGTNFIYDWETNGFSLGPGPNVTYSGAQYDTLNGIQYNIPGTFLVTLANVTQCCGPTQYGSITLNVEEVPATVGSGDETICANIGTPVNLSILGATSNQSISWSPTSTLDLTDSTQVLASPLTSTTYTAIVADSSGVCSVPINYTVTVNQLDLTTSSTTAFCFDGSATVTASGGSGSYTYLWDDFLGQTTPTAAGLDNGTYNVIVTDNFTGCFDTATVNVTPAPGALIAFIANTTPTSCAGGTDGSLTVNTFGGFLPFTYVSTSGATAVNEGSSYTFNGLSSGNYTIFVTDALGCSYTIIGFVPEPDSLEVHLDSLLNSTCSLGGYLEVEAEGGTAPYTYLWDDLANQTTNFATGLVAGTYCVTVTDQMLCSEIECFTITGPSTVYDTIYDTICQFEAYTFPSGLMANPNMDTTNTDTIIAGSGCDTLVTFFISVDQLIVQNIDTTLCQGQSFMVNGMTYSATGTFNDTTRYLTSGCDSIQYVVNVTVEPFTVLNIDTTICQGQSLIVNGSTYTSSGIFNDTARYQTSGCDSIQYLIDLQVDDVLVQNIDTSICEGQTLTINGITYTSSGLYNDTASHSFSGCDSIQYVINLQVDSSMVQTIDTTICQGQSLTVNGTTYTTSGSFMDTAFYAISGCDSIQYTIDLQIDSFIVENIDTTLCQGQTLTVNGTTYTATGNYMDTTSYQASGCDSIQYVIDLEIDSFVVQTTDTTICQGESITINGVTYNSTGVFNDTSFHAASGCDSIQYVIDLQVDDVVVQNIVTTIVQGDSLVVNGTSYTLTGIYNDTATYAVSACDSIQFVIDLTVDSFAIENIDTAICEGQTLTVNGVTYSATGMYNDTAFYTVSGGDSIQYVINLQVDSSITQSIDTTICQGQSLTVNGTTYTTSGSFMDTAFYAISVCDSIQYTIDLQIDSFIVENIDTTLCQGQTLTVNGTTYTATGNYMDTTSYQDSSCDSIQYAINIEIDSFVIQTTDTTICQGESITINGVTYNSTGVFNDTSFHSASGCDSIQYVIDLQVEDVVVQNIVTTIVQGDSLVVNGTSYTLTGIYNDTATYAVSACDSIQFVIDLTVDSFAIENIDTAICEGQTLTVNGITYTSSGMYNDTAFYTVSGGDSIQYVINLQVDSSTTQSIDTTICQGQSLTVNGTTYTTSGSFMDTAFYAISGCDSIQYTIDVQIDSFIVENIDTTLCQGQTLTVNGITYTATGNYTDTTSYQASGCDSIQYEINIEMDSFVVQTTDTTICQGESITINGVTYNSTGVFNDTSFHSASGCDSIQYVIDLQVDDVVMQNIVTTIVQGDSLVVNGTSYTLTGIYNDTATYAVSACDSIQFVIDLTVDSFAIENIDTAICEGQTLIVNGITYTSSGMYNDTAFYTVSGGDSIQYVINLQVDSSTTQSIDTTICQGQSLTVNGTTYTTSGSFMDTAFYAISGCDSIQYTIDVQIDSFIVENIDTTLCQGQTLTVNGTTYTNAGIYNDTASYVVSGCDSIQFVIDLQIDSFIVENIDTTVCQGESITVNGVTYTDPGVFNDTANYTASGCDSIQYVIDLQIDSLTVQNIDTNIIQGDSLIVNGVTYSLTGIYNDTAVYALSGCDSIQFVIDLTVDSFAIINIDTAICESQTLTVNGVTYTDSGLYNDTAYYTLSGGDSIQYVINLVVDSITVLNVNSTICQGQSLLVNGVTYSASGMYNDTAFYTLSGCDSIQYVIDLQIDSFIVEQYDTTICAGDVYSVHGFNYNSTGSFNDTVFYANSGCDSIQFLVNLVVDSSITEQYDTTICEGGSFSVHGFNYTSTGTYNDTVPHLISGCDSITFTVNLTIDSSITENYDTTICQGDVFTVHGFNYSNTGSFTDTVLYQTSGCDSIQFSVNLIVDSFIMEQYDTTICEGDVFSVHGFNYNSPGSYNDTLSHLVSGCDSIQFVVNLTVDSFITEQYDTTICQGDVFTVHGFNYNSTGSFNDTVSHIISGCDSIQFVVNLTVDSLITEQYDTTICAGDVYSVHGFNYNSTGTYNDTVFYANSGCDSIQFLVNLVVDSSITESYDTTICEGGSFSVHGFNYTSTGTYNDTVPYAVSGCDSITFVVNLAIDSSTTESYNEVICQGDMFTVHGFTYSNTGSYTDTVLYQDSGCDSIQFSVNLVVDSFIMEQYDTTICEGDVFSVHGFNYNAVGSFNDTVFFQNSACDSIQFVVNLIVHPTFLVNQNFTICSNDSVILPDGSSVNTSGTYNNNFTTVNGCDSNYITVVVVNQLGSFTAFEDVAVCDGFTTSFTVDANDMVSLEWFVNEGTGFVSLLDSTNYLGASTNDLIIPLDTSRHENNYWLRMVDACGNVFNDTILLEVFEPHAVENPIEDTTFCDHEIEVVTIDYNGNNYNWSNGEFGTSILVDQSGDYIVEYIENETNCLMSDTISISIEDCIGNCVVLAPSAFSPNGSGNNDIFRVVTTCDEGFSSFIFNVYNRYGELVFSTDDYEDGWDGTFKGTPADIGVFSFYVEYTKALSNEKEILRGNVTLIK